MEIVCSSVEFAFGWIGFCPVVELGFLNIAKLFGGLVVVLRSIPKSAVCLVQC